MKGLKYSNTNLVIKIVMKNIWNNVNNEAISSSITLTVYIIDTIKTHEQT